VQTEDGNWPWGTLVHQSGSCYGCALPLDPRDGPVEPRGLSSASPVETRGHLLGQKAHHVRLSDLWLRTTPRVKFSTDESPGLALMLTLIERLGLREITARILHELALGVRAAEAVGVALDRRIDGAIRLHVLVVGETPGTHVSELAGQRIGRTGKADDEDTG
jgi:hypothetical protein